jgi:hypothetical protein
VAQYTLWHNGALAYKHAGYKVKNNHVAAVEAHKLLTNPDILAEIEKQRADTAKRTEVTVDRVVQKMWANYERCVYTEELAAANKAVELLGRHTGAFPNKVELSGPKGKPIEIIEVVHGEPREKPAAIL